MAGTILLERYRIVGLLGRGGMGEVYRADDLKLAQSVALKFLPPGLEEDPSRVARFLGEVRLARRVSHPNVCTVYDVAEIGGRHFLSMEYVDGEDLGTLMRRIGRVPHEKALEIARQLCAGLAEAHSQGIIHRDLKPSNIMIDGRGRVRITDFGLAALAETVEGAEIRVGTPAYMAPEQLAGKGVSVESDIYSLGLVLHELFTGKPAFEATTIPELVRLQRESLPTPSREMESFDPAVERVLVRCLNPDRALRPSSVLAVAAALPGGDPLAAALAAGETPSPEIVAQAGEATGLRPGLALALLFLIAAGLVLNAFLADAGSLLGRIPVEKPPQALAVEAREILALAGRPSAPADRVWGFHYQSEYFDWIRKEPASPGRWSELGRVAPAPIQFWYRESPRALVPLAGVAWVTRSNPPLDLPGMARLEMSPDGRLTELLVVPPEHDQSAPDSAPLPDWTPFFERAGLQMETFKRVPSSWNPLLDCDHRLAWSGHYAGQPTAPIRVEAGSHRGRPVYFRLIAPWTRGAGERWGERGRAGWIGDALEIVFLVLIVAGALLLAWSNIKRGRGDRRGAGRLAGYLFGTAFLGGWVLRADHTASQAELASLLWGLETGLFFAAVGWLAYIAVEPYVRRFWPHLLISWSRLLMGRFRDPLVGRDILVGGVAGMVMACLSLFSVLLPLWLGETPPLPAGGLLDALTGLRQGIGIILLRHSVSAVNPLLILVLILVVRVLVRREKLSLALVYALVLLGALAGQRQLVGMVFAALAVTILFVVLIRYGVLALVVFKTFASFSLWVPLTADFSHWYAGRALVGSMMLMAFAAYGLYIALGDRSFFSRDLLAES